MKEYSYGVCPYRITSKGTEILLIQSKGSEEWGFIKGKIDDSESIKDCAKRECKEETNIKFKKKYLETYFEQTNEKKNIGIFLIDCINIDMSNIILSEKEIQKIKFFNIKEDIKINKNQKKILFKIKNLFWKRIYYFNK